MGKKRFFDDRLKYLSFIQNTSEKRAISEQLAPHIASMEQNRTFLRVLDAGTGDGTVKSNVIKTFHKYHPYTSLLITGKEISYEDLKNTLEKMPDRFVEHPNLLVTMTNVKFAELGHIESSNKIKGKNVKSYTLVLKDDNSFDFHAQINKLNSFIKKNWGIEIDNKSRTSYANPCIIRIYREDHKRYIEPFIDNDYKNNNVDTLSITIDDGYKDNIDAIDILNKYDIPFSLYVTTNTLNTAEYLSSDDVKSLSCLSNCEIGSHCYDHIRLDTLSNEKILYQLSESKRILENIISCRVIGISYPYGSYNEYVLSVLETIGYDYAACSIKGKNTKETSNYLLRRSEVVQSDSLSTITNKINGYYDFY